MGEVLKVGAIMPKSKANGPGNRFVIWLQGCSLRCSGCINSHFQNHDGGSEVKVDKVYQQILESINAHRIQGITLTGGEPLEQSSALSELIQRVKENTELDIFLFTGYEKEELIHPSQIDIWNEANIIVSGRYLEELSNTPHPWKGSSNQKVIIKNDNLKKDIPKGRIIELIIDEDGGIQMTGIVTREKEFISNFNI